MKVLIADDSLVTRKIIENCITSLGFDVVHATNGEEALKVLDQMADEIGLVLLDWNMPVKNGYETLKRIRGNDLYGHICTMMISTESEEDKIDQATLAGASGYVTKPFTNDELTTSIKSTLEAFKPK